MSQNKSKSHRIKSHRSTSKKSHIYTPNTFPFPSIINENENKKAELNRKWKRFIYETKKRNKSLYKRLLL